ncbi:cysteine desulfurase family protein [Flavobacterium sp.]|uniref:cysteine desulfurase family protein n=1 Tax=Flavobacterium sp. TaxID=239 RepID=UPI003341DC96
MKKIYLDNAATTPLREEVIQTMIAVLQNDFGNPSSTHSFGRSAKSIIETSRKTIAKYLNCSAQEIIFTSNATEGTNWILREMVKSNGIKKIITSKIEHHATLYTVLNLQKEFGIEVEYISVLPNGNLDLFDFERKLDDKIPTLVTLMHVNNEIGTLINLDSVAAICQKYNVIFHCDTVQSIGKVTIDLQKIPLDFLVASAHKFHGPKGIGFAFIRKNTPIQPMLYGGEQEKGLRAGTEAVHQIAGLAKAFEIANEQLVDETNYITELKSYCIEKLQANFDGIIVNGENTFYNILNVLLPFSEEKTALILFNLDMKGIAVSRGSACQSGSVKPSHVLAEFLSSENIKKPSLRISFSHYNTKEEIDLLIESLKTI